MFKCLAEYRGVALFDCEEVIRKVIKVIPTFAPFLPLSFKKRFQLSQTSSLLQVSYCFLAKQKNTSLDSSYSSLVISQILEAYPELCFEFLAIFSPLPDMPVDHFLEILNYIRTRILLKNLEQQFSNSKSLLAI